MKILLVDDHKIVRSVLGNHLKEQVSPDVDEANNGVEAIIKIKKEKYDLVITDINMPKMDGIELMKEIHEYDAELKVLALSMMDDSVSIKKMLKAGACGYVLKEGDAEELVKAIEKINDGEKYYSNSVTEVIMQSMIDGRKDHMTADLTQRELEIMRLLFDEKTNQEIADQLFISTRTVETHKYNIMEKTGSKNLAGLVRFAIREKLFDDLFY